MTKSSMTNSQLNQLEFKIELFLVIVSYMSSSAQARGGAVP